MKLKRDRKRSVEEVIADVREKVTTRYPEPMLQVEFPQLLQDMIGDLTSAPEPIAIKLFCSGSRCSAAMGAAGRRCHQEGQGRCGRAQRNRQHYQRAGYAVPGGPRGRRARRIYAAGNRTGRQRHHAGRARANSGGGERSRLHHSRALSRLDAILGGRHTKHAVWSAPPAKPPPSARWRAVIELPGQTEIWRENLQRDVTVTARLEGRDLGSGVADVQKARRRSAYAFDAFASNTAASMRSSRTRSMTWFSF